MMFLYDLHGFVLAALIVATLAGLALLIARVSYRAIPPPLRTPESMDLALRVMPALVSMTGFILAVSLVQARGEIARIERAIATEAATIVDLDRTLRRYDPIATAELRALLRAYAISIVDEAWPDMQRSQRTLATDAAYERFVVSLRGLRPDTPRMTELYSAIEKDVDALDALRTNRAHDATVSVPGLFWALILGLHFAIMALGGMFRPTILSMLLIGAQSAGIAALIALLFVHDSPFLGDTAVSPEPFRRAIHRLNN